MMDLFSGMVQKMKDGDGVTYVIDSQENEEALATTLETRDNEESDKDGNEDGRMSERMCTLPDTKPATCGLRL
jgi:hypothetical protein